VRVSFIFALLWLVISGSGNLFSQEIKNDSSEFRNINLNEVIISVNKDEERRKEVAQQIKVLSAKEIRLANAQSMADLISGSGDVFVQKSQMGGGSPVIRGFEASRILIVVDGIRMNNLIYRSGHLQNVITVDNTALDRLEVLFGPSSTVYGSDALGGVIHMYTVKPAFALIDSVINCKVNAFSRYGSVNNEFTNHIDLNLGRKNFASFTSITYSVFGDLRGGEKINPFYDKPFGERPAYVERINGVDSLVKNEDLYNQVFSGFSQVDLLQKFSYRKSSKFRHDVNLQYSNSSDIPRYDRLTDPDGDKLRYAEWFYGPQKRMLVAYNFQSVQETGFFQSMNANVSYQDIAESRHTRKFENDGLEHRNEKVRVFGSVIDFRKSIYGNNLRYGLDFQYNTLTSTANKENLSTGAVSALDTRYPDGDNSMTGISAYLSHSIHLNDKYLFTDGFRLGYSSLYSTFLDTVFFDFPYSSVRQDNFVYSGSLGLIHTPTDDWKLSLLLSTGFRTPNVDDLSKVFESEPGTLVVPNPDLKPEQTINTEFGVSKQFRKSTFLENSFYYTFFTDAIVLDEFQYNGSDSILYDGTMSKVYANQNKQKAFILGVSSSLNTKLSRNLNMKINFNYTYGRIKTDSIDYPLGHIPPLVLNLHLSYSIDRLTSELIINCNGWKRLKDYNLNGEDNEQYATPDGMPAWITGALKVTYNFPKFISLSGGVENILDTQYRTFSSGINAPGRNFYISLRFGF
jgi:hemoglobin/transferrin/lactoferrin receptor protein